MARRGRYGKRRKLFRKFRSRRRKSLRRRRRARRRTLGIPATIATRAVKARKFLCVTRKGVISNTTLGLKKFLFHANDMHDILPTDSGDQEATLFRRFALDYKKYRVHRTRLDVRLTSGQTTVYQDDTLNRVQNNVPAMVYMVWTNNSATYTDPELQGDNRVKRRLLPPGGTISTSYTWDLKQAQGSNWSDDQFTGDIDPATGNPATPGDKMFIHLYHAETPALGSQSKQMLVGMFKVTFVVELFERVRFQTQG